MTYSRRRRLLRWLKLSVYLAYIAGFVAISYYVAGNQNCLPWWLMVVIGAYIVGYTPMFRWVRP